MPCQQQDLLSELNREVQTWGAYRKSGLEKAKPGGMEITKNYVHAKYNCFWHLCTSFSLPPALPPP